MARRFLIQTMGKIRKYYNFKATLAMISAFCIFNNALCFSADTLRVPVGENRIFERMQGVMRSKPVSFAQIVQDVFKDKGYIVDAASLGSGWRCVVFKATEIATSKTVAIKIANPYGDIVPEMCLVYCWSMKSQVAFWKQRGVFNHNFSALVQLYDAGFIPKAEMKKYATPSNKVLFEMLDWDYHYQVMEFVDGKNVENLLRDKFFTNKDIIYSLVELIYGIDELHKAGLSHGELLPKNIIIDKNMKFKACDLDPLSLAYEKKEKDIRYLYSVARQILNQAYGTDLDDFFKQWTSDYVVKHGLRSFGDALVTTSDLSISIDNGTRNAI